MAVIQERVDKDGKTKYRVLIRLKGYAPQSATFSRKTDARNWAGQTEAAIKEGRHFKTLEAKKHTVADMIGRFVDYELPKNPKQIKDKGAHLAWWKKEIGYGLLSDISSAKISECRDKLLSEEIVPGRKRSASTANRYLASLSHVFNMAIREWEWLEINPVGRIKKQIEPRGRVRFLNEKERDRLLKECKESESPLLYPVVVLAISTGMRQGEIMNIKWEDIDLARGLIVLHETKNGERRTLPLTGHALELVKGLNEVRRKDNPYLFPSKKLSGPANLRKSWDGVLRKAGIENFHFHDLRHTAASYLAMNGATLAEIAEVLGHKTLAMVKRYAHLSDAHTASVVLRMNEKIFGGTE